MTKKKSEDIPIEEQIRKILEDPFWLGTLEAGVRYERLQDDHDGTYKGTVGVVLSPDGDAWFVSDQTSIGLRFRSYLGGGMSQRTRAAMLILAEAIRLDNLDRPQKMNSES